MIRFEDLLESYENAPRFGKRLIDVLLNRHPADEIRAVRLNMPDAMERLRNDDQWHNNALRVIAGFVRSGQTDQQILDKAPDFKLDGYSLKQTEEDIKVMIDGARKKGFDQSHVDRNSDAPDIPLNKQPLLKKFCDIELKPLEYLVEGLIPLKSLGMIFGDPGCGKTFLSIDIGMSIATGSDFHGKPVSGGKVIMVVGEGYHGVVQRAFAWCAQNNVPREDVDLYISRTAVDIADKNARAILTAEIEKNLGLGEHLQLLIIDTVARNFGGNDENSTKDMSSFVTAVDSIAAQFGCATLLVHHTGHASKGRARGAIALTGAVDIEYLITNTNSFITMECTKAKDFEEPKGLRFVLQPVEVEANGEIIKSAVLILRDAEFERVRITAADARNMDNFFAAHRDIHGESVPGEPRLLSMNEWREYYLRHSTADNRDTKSRAFLRCRNALVNKGLLTVEDDIYTWTPQTPGQVPDKVHLFPDI